MNVKSIADELCMGCMMPKTSSGKCSYCSYEDSKIQLKPYLPVKTVVAGKYIVGKRLFSTGDSTTYIGWDCGNSSAIFVTEYLPDALCVRLDDLQIEVISGRETDFDINYNAFLDLWRNLAKLRELSAISPVYDIVEDYGTVYVISEYEESVTLRDFLMKYPGGYMPWEEVKKLFMPMLTTLGELHHYGIYHGGISPSTLRICRDGRLRIFGFAVRNATVANSALNVSLPAGFAAIEQYTGEYDIGAWTDIYAVCACIYRALVGASPESAHQRIINDRLIIPAKINEFLPAYVVDALAKGLTLDPELRTNSVKDLRDELSGVPSVTVASDLTEDIITEPQKHIKSVSVRPKQEEKQKSSKKAVGITIAVMSVIFAAILVVLFMTVFREQFDSVMQSMGLVSGESVTTQYTTTSDMVAVPDFVASKATKESIAQNKIWNKSFYFVFEDSKSLNVEEGYICEQSIEPGTRVNKGSEIVLKICRGKPDMMLKNVIGMDKADAKEILEKDGFTVDFVEMENDGTHVKGIVNQMSKNYGQFYPYGTQVTLSVWGEPNGKETKN